MRTTESEPAGAAPTTEVAGRADFTSLIRYAQCWEDSDILLRALEIQPGDTCVSIASAGDNSLSLLSRQPGRVIAVDLNPAQLACVALRVAGFTALTHPELLRFLGSFEASGDERLELYQRCRPNLPAEHAAYWDARPAILRVGVATAGKFEAYFRLFRRWVLPLVHRRRAVLELLEPRTLEGRRKFYGQRWNTWRWRLMFSAFFSRTVMGRLGRDPELFRYVEGSVANRILGRSEHALTELDPSANPYLHQILTGQHTPHALPHALRPENFDVIRAHLHRFEYRLATVEQVLDTLPGASVHRYNLSDIFEYMSEDSYRQLLIRLIRHGRPGGRLAYWNMLVPRSRPDDLAPALKALPDLAAELLAEDKAFFYSRFVIEEIL